MTTLHYHHVDVFTNRAFGGNQLAVFTDGRGLSDDLMQQIAREMNFSETTFVLPPQQTENDYHVRIFTPAAELPMAGHPTIGTAYVLHHARLFKTDERQTVRFEEGVGIIPVRYDLREDGPPLITMTQPLPTFGPTLYDRPGLADMLSITMGDLHPDFPPQVVSTGVPFLFVPVRNLEAVQRIRLRLDIWERLLKGWVAESVFVFTTETIEADSTVHSRMFAPAMGVLEDPATGAASGPLGCYLVAHGIVRAETQANIISEQGYEMGRPSLVYVTIDVDAEDDISGVHCGGFCVHMGEGTLNV